jgi:hypothetical protein
MAVTYVDCSFCGNEVKVDDSVLGQKVECDKCGTAFVAEVGGTYDLKDSPKQRAPGSTRRSIGPRSSELEPSDEEPSDQDHKSWLDAWPEE